MKKLGKKAGQGATGKAASMKKAGHGALGKAAVPANKTAQEKKKKADVPGEWLYFAPEACLKLCTVENLPWIWRRGRSILRIR